MSCETLALCECGKKQDQAKLDRGYLARYESSHPRIGDRNEAPALSAHVDLVILLFGNLFNVMEWWQVFVEVSGLDGLHPRESLRKRLLDSYASYTQGE